MVSVIHPLVLAQLPEDEVVLERGDANRISLADGSMKNAFNVEQLRKLGTGKELWSQKMVVADTEASMVIGMNFMGEHQGILDMRENILTMQGGVHIWRAMRNWSDWICLTTTHVFQDILAVLHK